MRKILLKGMLTVTATIALSAVSIAGSTLLLSDFDSNQVKAEFLKKDIPSSSDLKGTYFETFSGKKYNTKDLIENKISGAFIHPDKKGEIIVISFQDDKESKLKTNKSRHEEITKDLINFENYDLLNSTNFETKEKKTNGSFHFTNPIDEFDYNAISISVKQIEEIKERAIKEGFSEKITYRIGEIILFHEMAHSHNQENTRRIKLIEEYNKQETEQEINLFHEKVGSKEVYRAENYADTFSLLKLAKEENLIEDGLNFKEFKELSTFLKDFFRGKKGHNLEDFNKHETRASLEVANNFIEKNWKIIGGISIEDLEDISRVLTDSVINNNIVKKYNSSYVNQQKLIENEGYSKEELKVIKSDVDEIIIGLIEEVITGNKLVKKINKEKLDELVKNISKKEENNQNIPKRMSL